jgi:hypothetical protein
MVFCFRVRFALRSRSPNGRPTSAPVAPLNLPIAPWKVDPMAGPPRMPKPSGTQRMSTYFGAR